MGNIFDLDLSILEYAEAGELSGIVHYLDRGGDVNKRDFYRNTALHRASCMGYIHIVSYLIEHGADVNAQAKDGWTPLHLASKWGRIPIIRILIEAGADNRIKSYDDRTAYDLLKLDSISEETKYIVQLLEHKQEIPTSPITSETEVSFTSCMGFN